MKKLSRKGFFILLIVIVLLVVVASFFFKHTPGKPKIVEEAVITPATYTKVSLAPEIDTSSWAVFTDKQLQYSIKYPSTVILDSRQTVAGRMNVFIFKDDQKKDFQDQIPALYIANTFKNGSDGLSAFKKSDCKKPCEISSKSATWININNVYGVKNPLPEDVSNYYLTDKDQKGLVINAYVGNAKNLVSQEAKKKMDTFEQMIRTIQFERTPGHVQ